MFFKQKKDTYMSYKSLQFVKQWKKDPFLVKEGTKNTLFRKKYIFH